MKMSFCFVGLLGIQGDDACQVPCLAQCEVGRSPRAASWVKCVLPQNVLAAVDSIGFMACPPGVVTMFAIPCFPELEEPSGYFPDLPLPGLVTRLPLGILSPTLERTNILSDFRPRASRTGGVRTQALSPALNSWAKASYPSPQFQG